MLGFGWFVELTTSLLTEVCFIDGGQFVNRWVLGKIKANTNSERKYLETFNII